MALVWAFTVVSESSPARSGSLLSLRSTRYPTVECEGFDTSYGKNVVYLHFRQFQLVQLFRTLLEAAATHFRPPEPE